MISYFLNIILAPIFSSRRNDVFDLPDFLEWAEEPFQVIAEWPLWFKMVGVFLFGLFMYVVYRLIMFFISKIAEIVNGG